MAFNRTDTSSVDPSATAQGALDHIDLLEKMRDMAVFKSATINSPTIAANGTSGYAVGDILEITDGASSETFPSTHPTTRANYEVTGVTSGQVDSVRLRNSGVYDVLPTDNGTTNEFDITILSGSGVGTVSLGGVLFAINGWTIERETSLVTTVTVNAGGENYVATDTVTLTDGGDEVVAAGVTIDTVDGGGAILTMTVDTGGVYNILPATLVVTGGSGTNGILNVTVYTAITDRTIEREMILSSDSGNTILGFRTFTNGTFHTIELSGLPAYNAANAFLSQPNISPGHNGEGDDTGQYIICRDTDPSRYNWFFRITDRYFCINANIDTGVYNQSWFGLGNPFATASEYALEMFIGGCASRVDFTTSTNAAAYAGPPFAVSEASGDNYGPCQVHSPGGQWVNVRAGFRSTNDIQPYNVLSGGAAVNGAGILPPAGFLWAPNEAAIPEQDRLVQLTGATSNAIDLVWDKFAGVPTVSGSTGGQPNDTIRPAPGDDPVLRECIVAGHIPTITQYMELDGMKWVDRTVEGDSFSAEDEVTDTNGDVWIMFNSGKLTTRQHWWAMKMSP